MLPRRCPTRLLWPRNHQFCSHPRLNQSHRRGVRTLPSFSLEGKTCVVTGAGRGLGEQFLSAFALSGARGACVDLTQKDSDESVDRIAKHVRATQPDLPVPELRGYECNVTIDSDVKSTWEKIVSDFGKVDVLLTAAGIAESMNAEVYDYARWRRIMDVNLDGSFMFAREAGRHMLEHQIRGSIILISSICGHVSVRPQKQAAYNVSKAGVLLLAKSLATEWGPHGIRVNSISPGYMNTEMVQSAREREGQEIIESWEGVNPMGRIGEPHELQGAAVWMASDASSYLNGSDILIDGGHTAL